jgi:hypothetical protein
MIRATIVKRLVFRLSIALLTFILGLAAFVGLDYLKGSPFSNELTLQLVAERQIVKIDEYPDFKVYITNHGKDTVTLVEPGDGSESAWRTPIVQWSILEAPDWRQHPGVPDMEPKVRSCGNVNALDWEEVFRLAPGETKELTGHMPAFRKPGTYSVTVLYANRPLMNWLGVELGTHHPIAMWRVRHSTETTITSNEVFVTVHE